LWRFFSLEFADPVVRNVKTIASGMNRAALAAWSKITISETNETQSVWENDNEAVCS